MTLKMMMKDHHTIPLSNPQPVLMVIHSHLPIRIPTMGKMINHSFAYSNLYSSSISDNIPLNLSTKSYPTSVASLSHAINSNKSSFLTYPFASLLSLAQQQYDPLPLHSSPTIKDYPYNRRQRERTTFDPHEETPRLLQIFTDTKHPTRYQIASICEKLNSLPCRKG